MYFLGSGHFYLVPYNYHNQRPLACVAGVQRGGGSGVGTRGGGDSPIKMMGNFEKNP